MFESIVYAFALIFILCGLFFLFLLLFDKIVLPKESDNYYPIVPAFHGDSTLPSTVYSAFVRANLFTFSKKNEVIVLDLGLDEYERKTCSEIVEGNATVVFCKPDEIEKLFVERSKKK